MCTTLPFFLRCHFPSMHSGMISWKEYYCWSPMASWLKYLCVCGQTVWSLPRILSRSWLQGLSRSWLQGMAGTVCNSHFLKLQSSYLIMFFFSHFLIFCSCFLTTSTPSFLTVASYFASCCTCPGSTGRKNQSCPPWRLSGGTGGIASWKASHRSHSGMVQRVRSRHRNLRWLCVPRTTRFISGWLGGA